MHSPLHPQILPFTHPCIALDISKSSNTAAFRLAVANVLEREGVLALQTLQEVNDPIGQRAETLLLTFGKDFDGPPEEGPPPGDDDDASAAISIVSVALDAEQFPFAEVVILITFPFSSLLFKYLKACHFSPVLCPTNPVNSSTLRTTTTSKTTIPTSLKP